MRVALISVLILTFGIATRLCYVIASVFWIEGDHLSAVLFGVGPLLVLAAIFVPNHPDME